MVSFKTAIAEVFDRKLVNTRVILDIARPAFNANTVEYHFEVNGRTYEIGIYGSWLNSLGKTYEISLGYLGNGDGYSIYDRQNSGTIAHDNFAVYSAVWNILRDHFTNKVKLEPGSKIKFNTYYSKDVQQNRLYIQLCKKASQHFHLEYLPPTKDNDYYHILRKPIT